MPGQLGSAELTSINDSVVYAFLADPIILHRSNDFGTHCGIGSAVGDLKLNRKIVPVRGVGSFKPWERPLLDEGEPLGSTFHLGSTIQRFQDAWVHTPRTLSTDNDLEEVTPNVDNLKKIIQDIYLDAFTLRAPGFVFLGHTLAPPSLPSPEPTLFTLTFAEPEWKFFTTGIVVNIPREDYSPVQPRNNRSCCGSPRDSAATRCWPDRASPGLL